MVMVLEGDLELLWTNKDLRLHAVGQLGYEWLPPDDPRALEVHELRPLAAVGAKRDRVGENLLVAGDALDALRSLRYSRAYRKRTEGGVRLVYIDPPFNTSQGFGQYRDSLEHSM